MAFDPATQLHQIGLLGPKMTEKRMLGASLRMRMSFQKKRTKTGDFFNKKKIHAMKFLKCHMDGTPKIVGFPPKSSI